MSASLPFATTEDIIRAAMKDDFYLGEITRDFREAAAVLLPSNNAITNANMSYMDLAVRAMYHFRRSRITQTPGEQYAGVLPIISRPWRLPSFHERSFWTLLRSLFSHLAAPEILGNLHLALFYLKARYFDVASRLLGVRYVRVHPRGPNSTGELPAVIYRFLAVALFVHIAISAYRSTLRLYRKLKSVRVSREHRLRWYKAIWWALLDPQKLDKFLLDAQLRAQNRKKNTTQSSERKCTLCLENMTSPTLTPCGHIFCWKCVLPWCLKKHICPLCRRQTPARKLVVLYQF